MSESENSLFIKYRVRNTTESLIFHREMIPITQRGSYSLYKEEGIVRTIDPFFINFLEDYGFIQWAENTAKINLDVTLINSLHKDNLRHFLAYLIVPHYTISQISNNHFCHNLTIPSQSKLPHYPIQFMELLITNGLFPKKVQYCHTEDFELIEQYMTNLLRKNKILFEKTDEYANGLEIALYYPPAGITEYLPEDILHFAKLLQRLFHDYLALAEFYSGKLELIINFIRYLNKKYGVCKFKLESVNTFSETLEDIGGINIEVFERKKPI